MDKFESELQAQRGMLTKLQVNTQTELESLKTDMTQKLTVVEAKADHNTKLQERTLEILEQRGTPPTNSTQAAPTQAASFPQAPQQNYQQPQQQQGGWGGQSWGIQKGWKGKGKGLLTKICYACGVRGHIARYCPQKDHHQLAIARPVHAIAADLLAAVNHYDQGGIETLPVLHLHEQMDDPEMQQPAALVCSVAMEVIGKFISMGAEGARTQPVVPELTSRVQERCGKDLETLTSSSQTGVNCDDHSVQKSQSASDSSDWHPLCKIPMRKQRQPLINDAVEQRQVEVEAEHGYRPIAFGAGSGGRRNRSNGKTRTVQVTRDTMLLTETRCDEVRSSTPSGGADSDAGAPAASVRTAGTEALNATADVMRVSVTAPATAVEKTPFVPLWGDELLDRRADAQKLVQAITKVRTPAADCSRETGATGELEEATLVPTAPWCTWLNWNRSDNLMVAQVAQDREIGHLRTAENWRLVYDIIMHQLEPQKPATCSCHWEHYVNRASGWSYSICSLCSSSCI